MAGTSEGARKGAITKKLNKVHKDELVTGVSQYETIKLHVIKADGPTTKIQWPVIAARRQPSLLSKWYWAARRGLGL